MQPLASDSLMAGGVGLHGTASRACSGSCLLQESAEVGGDGVQHGEAGDGVQVQHGHAPAPCQAPQSDREPGQIHQGLDEGGDEGAQVIAQPLNVSRQPLINILPHDHKPELTCCGITCNAERSQISRAGVSLRQLRSILQAASSCPACMPVKPLQCICSGWQHAMPIMMTHRRHATASCTLTCMPASCATV